MSGTGSILRVGLTGGIASGKSTVAGFLTELGAFVIDADQLTRQLMAPEGKAFLRIVGRFGREILDADGRIDRALLASRIFGDRTEREALNALVHPEVRAEAQLRFDRCAESGAARVGILDAALLVETGYYEQLDRLVVVRCSRQTQLRRLLRRNEVAIAEAEARIDAQAPVEQKLAVADYIIRNEGTLEETRDQTEQVYTELLRDYERFFGGWQD